MKVFWAGAVVVIVLASACKERLRACDDVTQCSDDAFCQADGFCKKLEEVEGIERFSIDGLSDSEIVLSSGPIAVEWIAAPTSECTLSQNGEVLYTGTAVDRYMASVELEPYEWTLRCVAGQSTSRTITSRPPNVLPFVLNVNGVLIENEGTYFHVFGTDDDTLRLEVDDAALSCSFEGEDFSAVLSVPCADTDCAKGYEVTCAGDEGASNQTFEVQVTTVVGVESSVPFMLVNEGVIEEPPIFTDVFEGPSDRCMRQVIYIGVDSSALAIESVEDVLTFTEGGLLEAGLTCASSSEDAFTAETQARVSVVIVNEAPQTQNDVDGDVFISWDISGVDRCEIGGAIVEGEANREGQYNVSESSNLLFSCFINNEPVFNREIEIDQQTRIASSRFYFRPGDDNLWVDVVAAPSSESSSCTLRRGNGVIQSASAVISSAPNGREELIIGCGEDELVRTLFWGTSPPDDPTGIHGIQTVEANAGQDYSDLEIAVTIRDGDLESALHFPSLLEVGGDINFSSANFSSFAAPNLQKIGGTFRLSDSPAQEVRLERLEELGQIQLVRNRELVLFDARSLLRVSSLRINENALCQAEIDALREEITTIPLNENASSANTGVCDGATAECEDDDDCFGETRCVFVASLGVQRCRLP